MRIFNRNSFAHRMIWTMVLASGIALSTLVATLLVFDSITSRALMENRLMTLAEVVGQNSTAALSFNDAAAAQEVLGALRAESPVVYACLYDSSGNLFASYRRASEGRDCAGRLSGMRPQQGNFLRVMRPVGGHGERVGELLVCSDLQVLEQRWKQLLMMAVLFAAGALGLGTITGSVLQRRLARPVLTLARAMRQVTEEHNLETQIAVQGSDEIKELSLGFNTMVAQLARREGEKDRAEARLQYQALNDELTGLPNRRLFSDRLTQTLTRAKRDKALVGLLYIDLDGFKLVNDSLGHAVGDQLLKQVGSRLRARVRASDTLARLGGDEFCVVLSRLTERQDAALVASGFLRELSEVFCIGNHEITIGASIGISTFPESATEAEDLLKQADAAMYAAKRGGKNQVMFFSPELGTAVRERMNMEKLLRQALAKGEIAVHYQPEFELGSGRVVRFEALARWTHETLGVIPPNRFIPIAEETGLIVPLGAYVMERACSEALTWQDKAAHPIQVAVNVSSLQFGREGFVDEVREILANTGLPPKLLQIELTESIMLTGVGQAAETMQHLRELGVGLAIDDFGTGYSCLSYLPQLPFDALKIDRTFVNDMEKRPEIKAVVQSLITLAHNMGMRVIVEGVEKEEQLQCIRRFGANEVQGFLMGKPTGEPAAHMSAQLPRTSHIACEGLALPDAVTVLP